MTILAVTGLQRERHLLAAAGVEIVVGGGDHTRLEATLDRLAPAKSGLISMGIAGGLDPGLKPGAWIVANAVLDGTKTLPADGAWTARLARRLAGATTALLLGTDAIVAQASAKILLHRTTGAAAVDMESHIVARVANRYDLPFAVVRVICDPAHRSLPPAACLGLRADGRIDAMAVFRSLLAQPWQLPALIRTGFEAERALRVLFGGSRRLGPGLLGPGFGGVDGGNPALDVT